MSKTKNKKRMHTSPNLMSRPEYWMVELQKSQNPQKVMHQIKANLPLRFAEELLVWIQGKSGLSQRLFGVPFPRTSKEWKTVPVASADYDREVWWSHLRIRPFITELQEFRQISEAYEISFIKGEYAKCMDLLCSVFDKFGNSLWFIKRKIHLLQLQKGLEEQKVYTEALKSDPDLEGEFVQYYAHCISNRAEPSVSPLRFVAQYEAGLLKDKLVESARSYLLYHIVSKPCCNITHLADVLNYESFGTIIDYYETLVATFQMYVASGSECHSELVLKTIYSMWGLTHDVRLLRSMAQLGTILEADEQTALHADTTNYKSLIRGNAADVVVNILSALKSQDRLEPADLLISVIASLDSSLSNEMVQELSAYPLISHLREICCGFKNIEAARDELCRYAWAIDGTVFAHLLWDAIDTECTRVLDVCNSVEFEYSLVCMGKYHPMQSWWTHKIDKLLEKYPLLKIHDAEIGTSCQQIGDNDRCLANDAAMDDFNNWNCSRKSYQENAFNDAYDCAKLLSNSTNGFFRKQSVVLTLYSLLGLNRIEECLDVVTNCVLQFPQAVILLPLSGLMEKMNTGVQKAIVCNISYPLLCHFSMMVTNGRDSFKRSDAAEDFLSAYNVKRPSQLRAIVGHFPRNKLLVFLKEICIEQVMDTWIEFSSSEDVALERVEVCRLLTDLCPEKSDLYQTEIQEIVRRLTIRKRTSEVEQSKIYVDAEGVKEVAKRGLNEDFKRYVAFRSSGMSSEHREAIDVGIENLKGGQIKEFLSLKFPRNEVRAILEKMILHVRDEFVANSQHGLDGYLSVRIRHGTLESQLRGPFEAESLLTHKCGDNKEYAPNEFWLEKLAFGQAQDVEKANKCFSTFSSQFDLLVTRLKKEWIQIKKDEDEPGKIDFVILDHEVDVILTCIEKDSSLDDFIDYVLDFFVTYKLEPSLKNIRRDLQVEIKPHLNDLLTQLQTGIERIGPCENLYVLRSAIGKARTAAQYTLDRVANWLRLSKTEKTEPYLLDEVISISESIVRASCPSFSVVRKIDKALVDSPWHSSLASFVDVMCLVFDNIVRHSGYVDHPQGTVNVTYDNQYVRIRVENMLMPIAATESKMQRVEEIRNGMSKQVLPKSICKEGGTGFIKAQKILAYDFKLPTSQLTPALSFGFNAKDSFWVDIQIPIVIREA